VVQRTYGSNFQFRAISWAWIPKFRENKSPFAFWQEQSTYRIIYAVDKRNAVVNVFPIYDGARAAFRKSETRLYRTIVVARCSNENVTVIAAKADELPNDG
jgi:hypothetical protein